MPFSAAGTWWAVTVGDRDQPPPRIEAGVFDGYCHVGHKADGSPGDAQRDPPINPNRAMRDHPRDADTNRMAAKNRATGGSKPPRSEIRVRGTVGRTMTRALPTLAVSRSGQAIPLDPYRRRTRLAVVVIAWAPSRKAYEAVHDEVGRTAAAGLIVHTASGADGKVRIVEVWESRQHIDEFVQTKLGPALEKLGVGMDPPELTETFSIERGIASVAA
jgi:hypothetical protein